MIIWDDALTISQRLGQTADSEAITFLNMMMNVGYKDVLQTLGRQVTEQQARTTLVAEQRNYQVPPDCLFPKTVVLIDGNTQYPLTEEPSDEYWTLFTQNNSVGRPERFHFRPRFGIGGGIIQLDPIPSSDEYVLELTFEATEKDLSKTKYTTGTVSVTQGSAIATGSGTTFTSDMIGRYLRLSSDGTQRLPYRIKDVPAADQLTLENVYQADDASGKNYEIFEAFALPEDCHMLPIYFAEWHWWDSKGNSTRAAKFESQWKNGLSRAKKTHSLTTRDNRVNTSLPSLPFPEGLPSHFPGSVI